MIVLGLIQNILTLAGVTGEWIGAIYGAIILAALMAAAYCRAPSPAVDHRTATTRPGKPRFVRCHPSQHPLLLT